MKAARQYKVQDDWYTVKITPWIRIKGKSWGICIGWCGFGETWFPGVCTPMRGVTVPVIPRFGGHIDYNFGLVRFRKLLPYHPTEEAERLWHEDIDNRLAELGLTR